MKFFTLYSAKYKKTGFKSSAREDAIFHSTFISLTQISGKLENNLNKLQKKRTVHVLHQTTVPMSHHWRRLQHTFRCFRTKTCHAAGKMNALGKSHVTFRMLSIKKETAFSFVLNKILDILLGRRILQQYQTIGEIFFRFHAKLRWKKEEVSLCSANAWIGTHATFLVILKWCCHFSVVQSFQLFKVFSSSLQHIRRTYKANIRDQLIENTTIVSVDVILSV